MSFSVKDVSLILLFWSLNSCSEYCNRVRTNFELTSLGFWIKMFTSKFLPSLHTHDIHSNPRRHCCEYLYYIVYIQYYLWVECWTSFILSNILELSAFSASSSLRWSSEFSLTGPSWGKSPGHTWRSRWRTFSRTSFLPSRGLLHSLHSVKNGNSLLFLSSVHFLNNHGTIIRVRLFIRGFSLDTLLILCNSNSFNVVIFRQGFGWVS